MGCHGLPSDLATQTLVLPLDELLASMGMIEGLVKQLLKDGVIQAKPTAPVSPVVN
jgi:hypothetical protein